MYTETDSLITETDRNERDFSEYQIRLCGHKIIILGVKIDRNTFNIDTNFIYILGISIPI